MKKKLKAFLILSGICVGFLTSCAKGRSIEGRWKNASNGAIEFSNGLYTMETNIIFTVAKTRGPYRISNDSIYLTAEKISFDDGNSWNENDGSIFPVKEQILPFKFNPDETISISNLTYKKAE